MCSDEVESAVVLSSEADDRVGVRRCSQHRGG